MARLVSLLFPALLFPFLAHAQLSVERLNRRPFGDPIVAMRVMSPGTIAAICAGGTLGTSNDDGLTWRMRRLPPGVYTDLDFAGSTWVAVGVDLLARSTDAGTTWSAAGLPKSGIAHGVALADEDVVVVVTSEGAFRSTDGGVSWSGVSTADSPKDVAFVGPTTGVLVNGGGVWRTTDRGATWRRTWAGNVPLRSVEFVSESFGVATDGNIVLVSTDTGASWQPRGTAGFDTERVGRVATSFVDEQTGIIVAADGVDSDLGWLARTSDGGRTWIELSKPSPAGLSAVSLSRSSGFGLAGGTHGTLLRSIDMGRTWVEISGGPIAYLLDAVVTPNGRIFAVGRGSAAEGSAHVVLSSDDDGATWRLDTLSRTQSIFDHRIAIDIGVDGFGVIAARRLKRTTDGGGTWSETDHGARDVAVTGPGTALIIDTLGKLARTTDAGSTWTTPPGADGDEWFLFLAIGPEMLGVAGGEGRVALTTDGGASWSLHNGPTDAHVTGGALPDPMTVVIATGKLMYRSSDGGATWTSVVLVGGQTPYSEDIHAIAFSSPTHGIAIGETGRLLTSTDGGATWVKESSTTLSDLLGMELTRHGSAIIVGGDGVVLRVQGLPSGITPPTAEHDGRVRRPVAIDRIELDTDASRLTIRLSVAQHGRVVLELLDANGSRAATIADGEHTTGAHTIEAELHGMPAGWYILRAVMDGHADVEPVIVPR